MNGSHAQTVEGTNKNITTFFVFLTLQEICLAALKVVGKGEGCKKQFSLVYQQQLKTGFFATKLDDPQRSKLLIGS